MKSVDNTERSVAPAKAVRISKRVVHSVDPARLRASFFLAWALCGARIGVISMAREGVPVNCPTCTELATVAGINPELATAGLIRQMEPQQ